MDFNMKHIHRNTGKKMSAKQKLQISAFHTGRKHSEATKEKMRIARIGNTWNKGKKLPPLSNEHKQKMSALKMRHPVSQETKDKLRKTSTGYKHTEEAKRKMSAAHKLLVGSKSPSWIADRTKLAKRQNRNDTAYKEWRKQVWVRDGFKCKIANGDCDGHIEAHHILPWRDYEELRYEVNNGITLCHAHHPTKRAEEKRLIPFFSGLVAVSN